MMFINKISLLFLICFLTLFTACSSKQPDNSWTDFSEEGFSENTLEETVDSEQDNNCIKIAYTEQVGNTITIPVKINGMGLDMIFDTGASTTCITLAEAQYLYEKGMLSDEDVVDIQEFQTADGNIMEGLIIILREVVIGNEIVLNNVEATVVQNQQAPLLLGQSVLRSFREISVDREDKVIKFFK